MFEIAYKTHRGLAEHNEDSIFINGDVIDSGSGHLISDSCLIAVCDGVGGCDRGEVASRLACEALRPYTKSAFTAELVRQYLDEADSAIRTAQAGATGHGAMATTLAALSYDGENVFAFNLGDSEIMCLQGDLLITISESHTLAALLAQRGYEAAEDQMHVITKCVDGDSPEPYIFETSGDFDERDVFILFSDGLGDTVTKAEIKDVFYSFPFDKICEELYRMAIDNGSEDNISIVTVRSCKNG